MAGIYQTYQEWREQFQDVVVIKGTNAADTIHATDDSSHYIKSLKSGDALFGGALSDFINAGRGKDVIEAGIGNDVVFAGSGNDTVLSFSWAGEPEIAQDTQDSKVEPNEPLDDNDDIYLGRGNDTLEFRWLIDAKEEILDKHRDKETNDVNYRAVAGENGEAHAHWVEGIGDDIVWDYDPRRDTLVFEGHTVTLDRIEEIDADDDGQVDDSVAYFYSEQGGNGAHQDDRLGSVTFIDYVIEADDIDINKGVFYGVEDPYSIDG